MRSGCLKGIFEKSREVFAEKRSKKGRAMGGIIMGRREDIERKREDKAAKEGVMTGKMCLSGKW